MKLNGIMLGTENPKALGDFYTQVLGEPGWQQDDWYGYQVGTGSLMIGPHSEVHGVNSSPGRIITIFETDELEKEFTRIKEAGATVVAEPYRPSEDNPDTWLATLADPDGNYFQLSTPWQS